MVRREATQASAAPAIDNIIDSGATTAAPSHAKVALLVAPVKSFLQLGLAL